MVELETNQRYAQFRPTCPTIGSDTKYQIQNPQKSSEAKTGRYMNVTDIFDSSTQKAIHSIERFLQEVIRNKLYWRRDILTFYGIDAEDMKVFLNYHQAFKQAATHHMS